MPEAASSQELEPPAYPGRVTSPHRMCPPDRLASQPLPPGPAAWTGSDTPRILEKAHNCGPTVSAWTHIPMLQARSSSCQRQPKRAPVSRSSARTRGRAGQNPDAGSADQERRRPRNADKLERPRLDDAKSTKNLVNERVFGVVNRLQGLLLGHMKRPAYHALYLEQCRPRLQTRRHPVGRWLLAVGEHGPG